MRFHCMRMRLRYTLTDASPCRVKTATSVSLGVTLLCAELDPDSFYLQ
jgi:hypothetical protein